MDFVTSQGGTGSIELREGTDYWGPFEVDFDLALSEDQNLSSVDVKAYAGKVTKKSDLSDETDITNLMIEDLGSTIDGTKYAFNLQHPGSAYKSTTATIVFTITTSSGGVYPFFFYPVRIY